MATLYQKTSSKLDPIDALVNSKIFQMNTAFPAEVVGVSLPNVSVQPLIKSFYSDTMSSVQQVEYPVIDRLPVMMFGSSSVSVSSSVSEGDVGIVIVCQGDVEPVYQGGGEFSHRRFDILDGVFIPLSKSSPSGVGNLEIKSTKTEIKTTGFKVENEVGELIQALVTSFTAISNLQTSSGETLNAATKAAIVAQTAILQSFLL